MKGIGYKPGKLASFVDEVLGRNNKLRAEARQRRKELMLRAARRLLVLKGPAQCLDPGEVAAQVPARERVPMSRAMLRRELGSPMAVWRGLWRVDWRTLFDPAELQPWTPELVAGLRIAGAILGNGRWDRHKLALVDRADLERDLGQTQVTHRLGGTYVSGGARWRSLDCFPVARLGGVDPASPSVLAGYLAGCRLVRRAGEWWLEGSGSERALSLLGRWGVAHVVLPRRGVCRLARVSPFYGALLWRLMPGAVGEAVRGLKGRVGMCPLLPVAYMKLARDRRLPSWSLPYGVGRGQVYRLGWTEKGLARLALDRFGLSHVSAGLAPFMAEWVGKERWDGV